MSLVNISYKEGLKNTGEKEMTLVVLSPDFNTVGYEREEIGELVVNIKTADFQFFPSDILPISFFPPEQCSNRNIDGIRSFAKENGYDCLAWSLRIYKKAQNILSDSL